MKRIIRTMLEIFGCMAIVLGSFVALANLQHNELSAYASEDGVTDFVSRLYTVILNRTPDEDGLATWTGVLLDGSYTGVDVAAGFITSDEFFNKEISNEEFVQIMYQAFFGREADPTGLATWVGMLDDGYRKSYIFTGFANSTEFGALCESYGIEAGKVEVTVSEQQPNLSEEEYNIWMFVERLYTEVLERTPDMSGIRDWVTLLQNGTWTGAEVSSGFIMSEEFQAKDMSNEEYVQIMYKAFFGREADEEGLGTWVTALENGYTKEFVFAGFADSVEFGVLCDKYGIIQGEIGNPEVTPTPGITETPAECFEWCVKEDGTVEITGLLDSSVTELVIPAKIEGMDVTSIGEGAFYWFTRITNIMLPESLTSIGRFAFRGCSIISIQIPDSVTNIGQGAFCECENLKEISVSANNKLYGSRDGVLYDKYQKTILQVPAGKTDFLILDNITGIGAFAFYGCNDLSAIEVPNSVTFIGDYAFAYCSNITDIELTDNVTSIGNNAFYCCASLANFEIPSAIEFIGEYVFAGCSSLTSIELPDNITSIGNYMFASCGSLSSIKLPDGITSIGNSAFSYCTSLTRIQLPDSVLYIDEYAFCGSENLVDIELPDNVTHIGSAAFMDCINLTSINIPNGVTAIEDYVFSGCCNLTGIELPDSVVTIGEGSFNGCSNLSTIMTSDNLTYIGDFSFQGCDNLVSIELPDGMTNIGCCVFDGCSSLTNIDIPCDVVSIGESAFRDCSSLTSIEIPAGVTSLGDSVFSGCESLSSIGFLANVTSIGNSMFNGCSNLTNIKLPDGITSIGDWAFYECSRLRSIEIPASVTSIGEMAFNDCSSLKTIWAYKDSYAEQWALDNDYQVEYIY